MTDVELAQALALGACKFTPGSTAKRFVAQMAGYARSNPSYEMSSKAAAFLDRLAHQYRKQIGRCMSVVCATCQPPIDHATAMVMIDALIERRHDFDDDARLSVWPRSALARYNTIHGTTFAHPYEYATKVAANNRRRHTLGDVYCRFCGEQLFAQVKQPHKLIAGDAEATRHLTICALQVLAGMRQPAKPKHRALPMELFWQPNSWPS